MGTLLVSNYVSNYVGKLYITNKKLHCKTSNIVYTKSYIRKHIKSIVNKIKLADLLLLLGESANDLFVLGMWFNITKNTKAVKYIDEIYTLIPKVCYADLPETSLTGINRIYLLTGFYYNNRKERKKLYNESKDIILEEIDSMSIPIYWLHK